MWEPAVGRVWNLSKNPLTVVSSLQAAAARRRWSSASTPAALARRLSLAQRELALSLAQREPSHRQVCASTRGRAKRKKERKQTTQGRDGRTARRHHTGILRRGVWCASHRPPLGVRLFLSHFAVSLRFSLQPSCHLAVAPFSSCSPLSLLPLSRRSPLPRSATAPPPADPLLSLLLSPFVAALPSSRHILAPRVYRALLAQGRLF